MRNIEERKETVSQALKQSFVDDYSAYKNIIKNINSNFKEFEIDYEWSYDDFCITFLTESLDKLDYIDIFQYATFDDFYNNFWNFNLIVVRTIIIKKCEELGYDYSKFEEQINNQNYLDSPQVKN